MKKLLILLIATHLSGNVFAQAGTILPDGFIIPNLAEAPACTVDDKGKMYFNSITKSIMVCNGTQWKSGSSQWNDNQAVPQTIYYNGKVGINTETPQFDLDVNGNAKVSSNLYIGSGLGIGTNNATAAIDVVDGDIALTSTVDNKTWKLDYSDDDDHLSIKENGIARMIFANGGNVGIGSATPTAKLSVDGSGSFTGNLTVNGGKGIVRTTSGASFKVHITQVNLGSSFSVLAGNCATSPPLNISAADYVFPPTVQIGNKVSGAGDFGKLIINVQSATSTSVVVRFCNNTSSNIILNNTSFNVLCIGL